MSELIISPNRRTIRWQLLSTVSALALAASACAMTDAKAADIDADRPTVWLELGGQFEQLSNSEATFDPTFIGLVTEKGLLSALDVQRQPAFEIGTEGKISLQPKDSDWIFSASLQYGRSEAKEHKNHQTKNAIIPVHFSGLGRNSHKYYYPGHYNRFSEGISLQSEQHLVLDFQAGKDVGLGMFGGSGSSVLSAGVRFAQFSSKSSVTLHALPDLQYPTKPVVAPSLPALSAFIKYPPPNFHDFTGQENSERSLHGIGPSLAWSASAPLIGNQDRGELTVDLGANVAVLFGRQKVSGQHQMTTRTYVGHAWQRAVIQGNGYTDIGYFFGGGSAARPVPHTNVGHIDRTRSVVVPNVGLMAGLSYLYPNAKISFGYRADFFFGAMDGGIDTRQTENVGFRGPFATISIGFP